MNKKTNLLAKILIVNIMLIAGMMQPASTEAAAQVISSACTESVWGNGVMVTQLKVETDERTELFVAQTSRVSCGDLTQ